MGFFVYIGRMKFRDVQFKTMFFPIHKSTDPQKVSTVERVEGFRRLFRDEKPKRVKAIKYFCYLYDKGSPLHTQVPVLAERKNVAAVLAGYDLEKDSNILAQMFKLSANLYIEIVKQMLKVQHSRAFSTLVAQEAYFEQILEQLILPVEEEEGKDLLQSYQIKAKLNESLAVLRVQIDTLYEEIFKGDLDLQEKIDIGDTMATPESYANKLTQ